jgi:hypothetical protein
VNDVRTAEDIRLGFSVRSVCRSTFAIDAEYLGYVNHDLGGARVGARTPAAGRLPTRARTPPVYLGADSRAS